MTTRILQKINENKHQTIVMVVFKKVADTTQSSHQYPDQPTGGVRYQTSQQGCHMPETGITYRNNPLVQLVKASKDATECHSQKYKTNKDWIQLGASALDYAQML